MTVLLYFSLFYSIIILFLIIGLIKAQIKYKNKDSRQKFISVIIACKNEEKRIKELITALLNQTYDKAYYEVIIADDNSTDNTAMIVKKLINDYPNFKYVFVKPESHPNIIGKKKAITVGVCNSKGEILAFTDADCVPQTEWIASINSLFTENIDFYAGYSPLIFNKDNFFSKLKNLERASIFAVCAGSFGINIPLTCTARNMAYRRSLWNRVNGFSQIEHLRSGDDDLMLLKTRNYVNQYNFSFDETSFVQSFEDKNYKEQLNQETRRGSKFLYYPLYVKLLIIFMDVI